MTSKIDRIYPCSKCGKERSTYHKNTECKSCQENELRDIMNRYFRQHVKDQDKKWREGNK